MNAAAIALIGTGHQILNNRIFRTGRCGIIHNDSKRIEIKLNDISGFGLLTQDLGGIYTYNTDGENSQIAFNRVHDCGSKSMGEGIYIDNNCANFLIHHNVIYKCETAIRTNKPGKNMTIYNNTAWNNRYVQKTTGGFNHPILINQRVFNNLSTHSWNEGTFLQNNLALYQPRFTDISNFDFTLKSDSPAIDAGITIKGLVEKFQGLAPDVGAYEFGEVPWSAGSSIIFPAFLFK